MRQLLHFLLAAGMVLTGLAGLQTAHAQPGDALDFDGSDDYVKVNGVSDDVANSSITVEAWYHSESIYNDAIFDFYGRSNRLIIFNKKVWDEQTQSNHFYNGNPFGDNQWHHIAVVHDTSTTNITGYIDGVQAVSYSTSVTIQSTDLASIGQEYDAGPSNYFDGKIDEVRIWSEARTQSEIQNLMHQELDLTNNTYSNLEAYYNFNNTGNGLTDQTSNGNDGTLQTARLSNF
jgi:hypothetical protein